MKTGEVRKPLLFEDDEKYEWGTCPVCKAPWRFEEELPIDSDTIPFRNEIKPKIKARTVLLCLGLLL